MKLTAILKKTMLTMLTASMLIGAVPVGTFADEVTSEETDAALTEESAGNTEVTPSSIATNIKGKFIALTFPDTEVPLGFSTYTVDYEGEQVELAQMKTKSATLGAEGLTVTLAYLTDADGSNGEFYICDTTNNAEMSDMIKIDGINGHYIIVLDPKDNIVGPDGFIKKDLKWGSKKATAWSLPAEVSTDEDSSEESIENKKEKSKKKSKDSSEEEGSSESEASVFSFTQKVYAAEDVLNETTEAASTEAASAEASSTLDESAQEAAMLALEEIAHTNAAGLVAAQTTDFCLLYALDDQCNLGFYLYDIKNGTYQRYVDVPHGETDTTKKYRKLSRTRLFIIVVLVVVVVILMFALVNLLLGGARFGVPRKDSYEDDEDDEEDEIEAIRSRVAKKEKARIQGRNPREVEGVKVSRSSKASKPSRPAKSKKFDEREYEDDVPMERNRVAEEVDWENMEITAGIPTKTVRKATEKKQSRNSGFDFEDDEIRPKKTRKRQDYDFDEDFDFEFLDIKK